MENYGELVAKLLQPSQGSIDFRNLPHVIVTGASGFSSANPEVVSKTSVKSLISMISVAVAKFGAFSSKPTPFSFKAGALVAVYVVIILVAWYFPMFINQSGKPGD